LRGYIKFSQPLLSLFELCKTSPLSVRGLPWRGLYCHGPAGVQTEYERFCKDLWEPWLAHNPHLRDWLNRPNALVAPEEYIEPKWREDLIVSPKRFGLHFFPFYRQEPFGRFRKKPNSKRNNENLAFKDIRRRMRSEGALYLVATCHGITLAELTMWTGKPPEEIKKSIESFIKENTNRLTYWVWAYDVDMRALPVFNKKSGSSFRSRLKKWNALNERPQFSTENGAKQFLPKYLHKHEAIRHLPKRPWQVKKEDEREADYFLPSESEVEGEPPPYNTYRRSRSYQERKMREMVNMLWKEDPTKFEKVRSKIKKSKKNEEQYREILNARRETPVVFKKSRGKQTA